MPMDAAVLAQGIVDKLQLNLGFEFSPEQEVQAVLTWLSVAQAIIEHVTANATISLAANDIHIDPGTFNIGGTPVIGQGENKVAALTGKIS